MGNFDFCIDFTPASSFRPEKCAGSKTLYSTSKGNSFVLMDLTATSNSAWKIITNHPQLTNAASYKFSSTSRIPNTKCLISKYLSAWFLRQAYIPKRIRHKYFVRLRTLLLQQWTAITNKQSSLKSNNRETKTFIKFSYKHTTTYLGFYVPCHCSQPCDVVFSQQRYRCHLHRKELIITPSPPPSSPSTHNANRNSHVVSTRLGISWDSSVRRFNLSSDSPEFYFIKNHSNTKDLYASSPKVPNKFLRQRLRVCKMLRNLNYSATDFSIDVNESLENPDIYQKHILQFNNFTKICRHGSIRLRSHELPFDLLQFKNYHYFVTTCQDHSLYNWQRLMTIYDPPSCSISQALTILEQEITHRRSHTKSQKKHSIFSLTALENYASTHLPFIPSLDHSSYCFWCTVAKILPNTRDWNLLTDIKSANSHLTTEEAFILLENRLKTINKEIALTTMKDELDAATLHAATIHADVAKDLERHYLHYNCDKQIAHDVGLANHRRIMNDPVLRAEKFDTLAAKKAQRAELKQKKEQKKLNQKLKKREKRLSRIQDPNYLDSLMKKELVSPFPTFNHVLSTSTVATSSTLSPYA